MMMWRTHLPVNCINIEGSFTTDFLCYTRMKKIYMYKNMFLYVESFTLEKVSSIKPMYLKVIIVFGNFCGSKVTFYNVFSSQK